MAVEKERRNGSLFSSFYTFTVAGGWWKSWEYLPQQWGSSSSNKGGPAHISDTPFFPWASSLDNVLAQFTGEKTGSVDVCSHPLQTILRLFHDLFLFLLFFCPRFHPCMSWRSHDCLPLLLHHRRGFLVLAGPRVSWMLLIRNVKFLSWWRYRVLWDRAILHVPREVPVPVYRYRSQSRGEVEGQWSSGSDVGDTGVWHHGSIAVSVTAAPSFSFEVQGQSPPAPGLFYLSLHLRIKDVI